MMREGDGESSSYEVINKKCAFLFCVNTSSHRNKSCLVRMLDWPDFFLWMLPNESVILLILFFSLRWWTLEVWTAKRLSEFHFGFLRCCFRSIFGNNFPVRGERRKMDSSASENNIHFRFINLIRNSITHLPLLRKSFCLFALIRNRHLIQSMQWLCFSISNQRKKCSILSPHSTHLHQQEINR